jgi:signal transduction histidine kinase
VTVRLLAPAGELEVAAPPELVERAVAPVLDNAVRHASRQVFVTAGLDGRDVVVDVSDDGSGIEQVRPESIFRAGVHASDSGGAGLGLSLARRVAASIGGSVEIRSSRSPTTLRIRLPRR